MAKCDYITGERKEGEDSIWGEVYHTVGEGWAGGCCGPCACHRVGERSVNHHHPLAASFQEVVVVVGGGFELRCRFVGPVT